MRRPLAAALAGGAALLIGSTALAGDSTFVAAHLSGANEEPARDTKASGNAVFQLSEDATELDYRLIVANIDNVVAAHIHRGPEDVNGPVVALLYAAAAAGGPEGGVIATGTITAADLSGPLAGQPLSALVDVIEAGDAYVNVHTNNGVAPTNEGPGDFPGGEIRAQMK
jgi:hypothetical protein